MEATPVTAATPTAVTSTAGTATPVTKTATKVPSKDNTWWIVVVSVVVIVVVVIAIVIGVIYGTMVFVGSSNPITSATVYDFIYN